jgi:hypothetical protein
MPRRPDSSIPSASLALAGDATSLIAVVTSSRAARGPADSSFPLAAGPGLLFNL